MEKYNHKPIEKKWQDIWEEKGVFHASNDSDKEKFYPLVEFPYPSGQGLHVGHPRSYTALDVVAREEDWMDIMYFILSDGMHLAFLQKTMQSKTKSILKLLRRTI